MKETRLRNNGRIVWILVHNPSALMDRHVPMLSSRASMKARAVLKQRQRSRYPKLLFSLIVTYLEMWLCLFLTMTQSTSRLFELLRSYSNSQKVRLGETARAELRQRHKPQQAKAKGWNATTCDNQRNVCWPVRGNSKNNAQSARRAGDHITYVPGTYVCT